MPVAIDLFCGLGGWTEGFLAEGWDVIGFDNERHQYGEARYPAQLVLQDVLTLHGSQFRTADCIVASPPCQEFSYMAMPWKRGKRIAAALRGKGEFPEGYTGSRTQDELTALFEACFRLQREACNAARRHIPMVAENVKGAQPWVGMARAHFGSYYLWGDVASVGGAVVAGGLRFGKLVRAAKRGAQKANPDGTAHPQGSWLGPGGDWFIDGRQGQDACAEALKVLGFNFHQYEKTGQPGGSFQSAAVDSLKVPGISFSGYGEPGYKAQGFNVVAAQHFREEQGAKQGGDWFSDASPGSLRNYSSRSNSRKAASAQIAKIPFALSSHIARCFRP